MNSSAIGKWAFIIGLILAVLAGLGLNFGWVPWVLAVIGLIVGFLNVSSEEAQGFLLAAIALMLSATAIQTIPLVGDLLTRILSNIVAFIAAAVLVVAVRSLFVSTRD